MEDVMVNVNKIQTIAKIEAFHDYKKLYNKIPALHFDKEWGIKIIPPFTGATTGFWINHNGKHISVYFDGYDENGKVIPYFEYYDGNETYRYLLDKSDKMMDDIRNFLNN